MGAVHATLAEVVNFLRRHPPFSDLTAEALAGLARAAEIEYFPAGAEISDDALARHLFVVWRGAVDVLDGDSVDVLDAGESFGAALSSQTPPGFGVRAREDTLCLLFPVETSSAALSSVSSRGLRKESLERRLERRAVGARAATRWGAASVGAIARKALVIPAETTIRDAARGMTAGGENCVVVYRDGDPALVTDRDLRERVVVAGISSDAPLGTLADRPAILVSPDRLVLDALVEMLDADADHLLVVHADGGLLGVVDHAAFLEIDGSSPVALRRRIDSGESVDEVAIAAAGLPAVAVRLLDAHVEPLAVLTLLSTASDAVARRLSELAIRELGSTPVEWAWLAFGSEARREQTLATDQDNGLAYAAGDADAAEYFAAFAERMNAWLSQCGYAECRAGVMARNRGWRLSRTEWTDLVGTWLRTPSTQGIHMAMIALDVRSIAGSLPVELDLRNLAATATAHPAFVARLRKAATELRPPTGFLREFVVERSGEHAGSLDIKQGGVAPIVNLARAHAIAGGSGATSTVDRLRDAAARGSVSDEVAQELRDAFIIVNQVRLEHQAAQVERGVAPDNHVDPRELPPEARRGLKEAFRAIARAQRTLEPKTTTRIP